MTRLIKLVAGLALVLVPSSLSAAENHAQPYAGLETRSIASLSASDVEDLRGGAGWGLALPAELNNHPGPAHLLEHADALDLNADQRTAITAMVAEMRASAIPAGERLIAAEAALDDGFQSGGLTDDALRALLAEASAAREDLRFVHLSQHLRTVALLSPEQIAQYNVLRGYGEPDPCANVPEGHNAAMWRRHNGCD